MTLLIFAHHNSFKLKSETLNLVTAAHKVKANIHILVTGYHCLVVTQEAALLKGISKILYCDHISL